MSRLLLVLALCVSFRAGGTEVDNITSFYEPLADAEVVLNAKVQELIVAAQARHFGCRRNIFARQAAAVLVGNVIFGTVEYFANNSELVERSYTPVGQSIYRGTPYQGGIVDTFVNLGPTVNVAGHHVGTDKLGHFFDMGWDLYGRTLWGASIEDLLAQSRREETGLWGLWSTGIKSYGDIASNFDGYRFWKEFVEPGPKQYFNCENGRLRQVREFRWSDYISAGWNEAINCNAYWNQSYSENVNRNTKELETRFKRRYQCPIEPNQCEKLRAHYSAWIPRPKISELVSPLCR